jgi:dethiobiotin synthetase
MGKILFITGTDTGAGKTFVTAVLLQHLINQGVNAMAMKPFCAGSLGDARLLRAVAGGKPGLREIAPFHFSKPLAPGVQRCGRTPSPTLGKAVEIIQKRALERDLLLVEGCGGVMVPLGENYMVLDLIKALKCAVLVVAPNRLGGINHLLLTLEALKTQKSANTTVFLTELSPGNRLVKRTNAEFLGGAVGPKGLISLGFSRFGGANLGAVKKSAKKFKKTLARFFGSGSLLSFYGTKIRPGQKKH